MSDPLAYNTIGQLRIEKDRLQARIDRYEQLGDRMTENLYGPTAGLLHAQWIEARGWDGCPKNDTAGTHRYYKGNL